MWRSPNSAMTSLSRSWTSPSDNARTRAQILMKRCSVVGLKGRSSTRAGSGRSRTLVRLMGMDFMVWLRPVRPGGC